MYIFPKHSTFHVVFMQNGMEFWYIYCPKMLSKYLGNVKLDQLCISGLVQVNPSLLLRAIILLTFLGRGNSHFLLVIGSQFWAVLGGKGHRIEVLGGRSEEGCIASLLLSLKPANEPGRSGIEGDLAGAQEELPREK